MQRFGMMGSTQTLELPGYVVLQYLGSGARSAIWQVRERDSDKVYALKRTVRRQASDSRFLEQAANEYDMAARLNHPNIRKIHEIRRIRRWLALKEIHLLMELCEGQTVQANRPQTVLEAVEVYAQVAGALSHMHNRGVIHCDIKPNNIIVAADGTVKLIDLGQSCLAGTVKARIQGTPDFIAPEQVHRGPVDARTDVYNFGAALYWTLTGRPVPTVLPREGSLTVRDGQRVTPVDQINEDVPASLSKLVTECIQLSPAHRPSNMSGVFSRLSLVAYQFGGPNGNDSGGDK
jgi:serine/threonine-protein kinase